MPGGEMPKWLLPNKEGYISFTASKDLYEKFLGLAFCVVFRENDESRSAQFELLASINFSETSYPRVVTSSKSDHVWLEYFTVKEMWKVDEFGPNDSSHFHFSITVHPHTCVIVKNCGFRLQCKPLENDMEVLLQDDQLWGPALQSELWSEHSQTSTEEESSSKFVHKGVKMADFSIEKHRYSQIPSRYRKVFPGREMPKEFVLVEDSTVSFMASEDLLDKFLGLVLCVVIGVEDGEKEISFDIMPHVNGRRRDVLSGTLGSFDSDQMWIQFLKPNQLWGILRGRVDFGQFEESYLQFSLRLKVSGGTLKKLGYSIRCKEQEDDLKAVLQDNPLVDPAVVWETDEDNLWEIVLEGLGMTPDYSPPIGKPCIFNFGFLPMNTDRELPEQVQ